MRVAFLMLLLASTALTPLASAAMVTRSCTMSPDGSAATTGSCSVSAFASTGISVLLTVHAQTRGVVLIEMANSNGGRIEWMCRLDGTSHPCPERIVDTGGPNAGTWTVTGRMTAGNAAFHAYGDLQVDFFS